LGKHPGVFARWAGETEFASGEQGLGNTRGRKGGGQAEPETGDFQTGGDDTALQQFAAAELERDRFGAGEGIGLADQSKAGITDEHAAMWIEPDFVGGEKKTFSGETAGEEFQHGAGHAQAAVVQDANLENQGGGEDQPK
jgi:hypothetical protein